MGVAILIASGLFLIFLIQLFIFASQYTKAGPNEIRIISGLRRVVRGPDGRVQSVGFRNRTGGGTFVWPVLEKCERLSLEVREAPIRIDDLPTKDGIGMRLDAAALFKVKGDEASILRAAEGLLSKSKAEIVRSVELLLTARIREAAAPRGSRELQEDTERVVSEVQYNAAEDLARLGLELERLTIQQLRPV